MELNTTLVTWYSSAKASRISVEGSPDLAWPPAYITWALQPVEEWHACHTRPMCREHPWRLVSGP